MVKKSVDLLFPNLNTCTWNTLRGEREQHSFKYIVSVGVGRDTVLEHCIFGQMQFI